MNFRQFAFKNVKRNVRAYLAYFLSSSFAVMIFFIYAMFIFHPDLAKTRLGEKTQIFLSIAEVIVFGFAFFFVLYSISSFLKVRNKEFGILTILGAQKKQLNRLIFFENILIGSFSILAGIVCGLFLAKFFLLLGAKVVGVNELPLYLPVKATGLTIVSFLVLFIIVSSLVLWLIRSHRVLELLTGSSKPKTEPKVSILLALLSIACMFSGLLVLYLPKNFSQMTMLSFLGLGIIGTYFFFTQFTGVSIRLLKKNRSFFWRNTHLLWVSEMAYKIKDNARMFFMVTIMTTMACSSIGFFVARSQEAVESFKQAPNSLAYIPFEEAHDEKDSMPYQKREWYRDVEKIDQALKQANVKFDKVIYTDTYIPFLELDYSSVISLSDYNQLAKIEKRKEIRPLNPNEAVIHVHQKAKHEGLQQLSFAKEKINLRIAEDVTSEEFDVVVSDKTFQQLKNHGSADSAVRYVIPEWDYKTNRTSPNLLLTHSTEIQVAKQMQTTAASKEGFISSRGLRYLTDKAETNVPLFILVFIAAIFSVSAASFIYFKLYTELRQDQRIYNGLSKIGVSTKEMNRSATIQIAILFFLPMFVAAFETVIGLIVLNKHFGYKHMFVPSLIGVGSFFIAQLIFFLIVRYRYILQLKRAMI
ncbi:putative ABC transport system permease protein [Thermoactinomyces sp. DSM 45891]|uniref:FtsX-like permease family protein n=1 Tax=Thermoactinomyces sp. DSM 45891 TaxID=1761907 RepID=UPI000915F49E|nr:ABC transporter permease [Thermoactinomyces sp. DSM 45891]SFX13081.1 putative ABC transport system permease protein [Thermoactinomyces sp. DSM 45891]